MHRKRQASGYNAIFLYPEGGLNCLAQDIAKVCDIHYAKRAVSIDTRRREICFADKTLVRYGTLISSVPLNCVIEMAGLKTTQVPDPYTSMLVLNIGATKGKRCPKKHWLYIPDSGSGFFRIGFYSNVNTSFLPRSSRRSNDRVSIYVERAFKGGMKPSKHEIEMYSRTVIRELQDRDFIKEAEVVDPSWVDVAYTWSWPGSTWREEALRMLSNNRIYQIGRYGRWKFQGIADSIIDGLNCVESVKR